MVRVEHLEHQNKLEPGWKRLPGGLGIKKIQQRISKTSSSGTSTHSGAQGFGQEKVQRPCNNGYSWRGKSMQISWDISSRIQRSAFMNSKKSEQKCFDHYERNTKTNKTCLTNMSRITRFVAFISGNKSKHVFKQMELQKTTKRHADIFQLSSRL